MRVTTPVKTLTTRMSYIANEWCACKEEVSNTAVSRTATAQAVVSVPPNLVYAFITAAL
jgi:hypothetical protein